MEELHQYLMRKGHRDELIENLRIMLESEDYDTDALIEDIASIENSNISHFINRAEILNMLQGYTRDYRCMFNMLSLL